MGLEPQLGVVQGVCLLGTASGYVCPIITASGDVCPIITAMESLFRGDGVLLLCEQPLFVERSETLEVVDQIVCESRHEKHSGQ